MQVVVMKPNVVAFLAYDRFFNCGRRSMDVVV
jgi:hypothetical protein